MKNYKKIRLFEQAVINQEEFSNSMENQPEMKMQSGEEVQPMQNVEPSAEEKPLELPTADQSVSGIDVMSMTVRDFISKCKEVDPLVCMGLETFLENNKDRFQEQAQPAQAHSGEQDLTFSNVVAQDGAMAPPAPAQQFSLDQSPEVLNFPS
jgi:hypothetical protein